MQVNAQAGGGFKINSATKVNWSGGVAGRMGVNYTVGISWNAKTPAFTIDSVWCNGYGYAIGYNYKQGKSTKPQSYQLTFAEDNSHYYPRDPSDNGMENSFKKTHTRKAPIKYDGKVLIRYITSDKKKHYLVVKEFTKTSIVSYP
jgi:hypothetical protein